MTDVARTLQDLAWGQNNDVLAAIGNLREARERLKRVLREQDLAIRAFAATEPESHTVTYGHELQTEATEELKRGSEER